jgi:O-antigen/teichoic acid export membrane protein
LLFSVVSAGLVVVGGLVVVWAFRFHQFDPFIAPLAVATAVFLAQDYYRRYFFVIERPVAALASDIIGYGAQFVIVLIFGIMGNLDADDVLWAMAFAFFLGASLAFVRSGRKSVLEVGERSYLRKVCRENYDFGKWLLGVNMMYWGQAQTINYFVAGALSVTIVGALNACKNVLGILNVFFLGLQNILLPEASRALKDGGKDGLGRYLKSIAFFGGMITLLVVLVAGIWSECWLKLFYGSAYRGYGWIVVWWGIYFFVAYFHRPYSTGLSVLDRTKQVFQSMLIGFVLFVILGYVLTMLYEIHGVMTLMCFSNLLTLVFLAYFFKRETKRIAA